MSLWLTRHHEHEMSRETPVSRLSTMRETGVSRDIFKGVTMSRRSPGMMKPDGVILAYISIPVVSKEELS